MLAPILAFAGVAAVQAGPLRARQATSAISSAVSSVVGAPSSVASSAASAASSVVGSATSSASSAVETASSAASSGVESASSAASSAASSSAPTTGNESFPLYPCPTGFLLTYVELNQTVPLPVTQVTQQFGEWANSSYFPNVTASQGGNEVGATHTINLQGVDLIETLVNASMAEDSGAARWTWNLTNGPVSAMGVSLSNYSTVLSIYDPTFDQTGTIGNETTLLTYTNFCANSQAQGMQLVSALAGLELGTFAASLGGAAPGGQPAPSSVSMSAGMMTSSVASSAEMATSMVSSSAAAATSSAGSAASSAGSAASSGAAGVTSSIAAGVSSAVSAALPSSSA